MADRIIYDQFGTAIRTMQVQDNGDLLAGLHIDCEPIVDHAKVLRENQTGKEVFRLAATVPAHVAEQSFREGWFHDDDAWKKWLNDNANRDFRVWEGRI
jgi:hypothetical protein